MCLPNTLQSHPSRVLYRVPESRNLQYSMQSHPFRCLPNTPAQSSLSGALQSTRVKGSSIFPARFILSCTCPIPCKVIPLGCSPNTLAQSSLSGTLQSTRVKGSSIFSSKTAYLCGRKTFESPINRCPSCAKKAKSGCGCKTFALI